LADTRLRNVTVLSSGPAATALIAVAQATPFTVSIKNSILRGDPANTSDLTVGVGGPGLFLPGNPICATIPSLCLPTVSPTVTVDHSNFRGALGTLTASDNQTADPQLGTDGRPAAGSPVIDAGTDDADNGATDLAGVARKQGAAVDMGAFEFPVQAEAPQQPATPSGGGEPVITPPPPDGLAPGLSALGLTNKTFAVGPAATPVSLARAKKGTTFVYSLSEPARTAITIEQSTTGRRKGKSCVKATKKNRKAKKCTRYVRVGALERSGANGANAVPFSGRIGKKALKPGAYRASFVAVDAAGNKSKPKTVGFKIVKK
jgi:hypothetical protein